LKQHEKHKKRAAKGARSTEIISQRAATRENRALVASFIFKNVSGSRTMSYRKVTDDVKHVILPATNFLFLCNSQKRFPPESSTRFQNIFAYLFETTSKRV